MDQCKQFRQWIWLALYDELPVDQKEILEQHVQDCPECQLDYEAARQTVKVLNHKLQLEASERQLNQSRTELHQRLLLLSQPRFYPNWLNRLWKFVSLDFTSGWRMAFAAAVFVIGLFLGKILFYPENENFSLSTGIAPALTEATMSNIEAIQYDPASRQVTIQLSTVNDMVIQGNVEETAIQQLLANSLMTEDRPNIRLQMVKALQQTTSLNENLIYSLSKFIDREENPGIRLKAVRLLTSIPISSSIKEILARVLVRVLLNDPNAAIRIEAFNGLIKLKNNLLAPVILNAAKSDSSEYIRLRARQMLERTENPMTPEK